MRRGDIICVAVQGDYGKPRPAVVIQSDALTETDSVLVCLMTTTLRDASFFRITIEATSENGLDSTSQIMVDKIMAVRRDKCRSSIGKLNQEQLTTLNRTLPLVIGISD